MMIHDSRTKCAIQGKLSCLATGLSLEYLVDNCIQNILLGRYVIGYTVGNHVIGLLVVIPILMHFYACKLYYSCFVSI